MKKRFVVEAIAIAIVITCLLVIWINLTLREKEAYIKGHEPYQEFGIEVSHDEYVDNKPEGRYTKSGIRILPKSEK